MPSVELRFSPLPAHVRTARLVAVTMARRAGVSEDLLDEVRLAVGEACSRAVQLHRAARSDEPVLVVVTDDEGRFTVSVTDRVPAQGDTSVETAAAADLVIEHADESGRQGVDSEVVALPPQVGLAVIAGIVDEVSVQSGPDGATVGMSWPASGTTP